MYKSLCGIAGSYDKLMFNCTRNCQAVLQNDRTAFRFSPALSESSSYFLSSPPLALSVVFILATVVGYPYF